MARRRAPVARGVGVARRSGVDAQPAVGGGEPAGGAVGRSVVGHDDLEAVARERLRRERGHELAQRATTVAHGHDDADIGLMRHPYLSNSYCHLPAHPAFRAHSGRSAAQKESPRGAVVRTWTLPPTHRHAGSAAAGRRRSAHRRGGAGARPPRRARAAASPASSDRRCGRCLRGDRGRRRLARTRWRACAPAILAPGWRRALRATPTSPAIAARGRRPRRCSPSATPTASPRPTGWRPGWRRSSRRTWWRDECAASSRRRPRSGRCSTSTSSSTRSAGCGPGARSPRTCWCGARPSRRREGSRTTSPRAATSTSWRAAWGRARASPSRPTRWWATRRSTTPGRS